MKTPRLRSYEGYEGLVRDQAASEFHGNITNARNGFVDAEH